MWGKPVPTVGTDVRIGVRFRVEGEQAIRPTGHKYLLLENSSSMGPCLPMSLK